MRTAIEREIKLTVGAKFRLPPALGRPLQPRWLTSRYYDRADFRLAHGGITLRRRIEGGRGRWQLKLPVPGARRELEATGPAGNPPTALRDLLLAYLRNQPLTEICAMRTHRKGVRVTNRDGDVADVVLDSVTVLSGRSEAQRFREMEVELIKGSSRILFEMDERLREAGAEEHDGRPKLFRALGLPARVKPEAPPSAAPIEDQLAFMLTRQVDAVLSHDPGVRWGGDPEYVHQMRVATRRLRAILRAARPLCAPAWSEPIRTELAWLGGLLGPVRDLDVQIDSLRGEAKALDKNDRRPLTRFVRHLLSERQKKQDALVAGLRTERYLRFIEDLSQSVKAPEVMDARMTLGDIARREFKKLRKAVQRLKPVPTDAALHHVRIKTKRARYAAELAQATVGKGVRKFLRYTKDLQDLLGDHQDAVVGEQRVRALFAEAKGRRAAFTAGRIVERQRQIRDQVRGAFRSVWKKVDKQGKKTWK